MFIVCFWINIFWLKMINYIFLVILFIFIYMVLLLRFFRVYFKWYFYCINCRIYVQTFSLKIWIFYLQATLMTLTTLNVNLKQDLDFSEKCLLHYWCLWPINSVMVLSPMWYVESCWLKNLIPFSSCNEIKFLLRHRKRKPFFSKYWRWSTQSKKNRTGEEHVWKNFVNCAIVSSTADICHKWQKWHY